MPADLANVYTLRVESANVAEPTSKWLNTVDIFKSGGAPAHSDSVITAFVQAIVDNQWSDSQVQRISLRNWTRGKVPLDESGNLWIEEGLTLTGNAETVYSFSSDPPADTDICMLMHKDQSLPGGRVGKLYLHNLFRAGMVNNKVGRHPVMDAGITGFPALVTGNFTTNCGAHMGEAHDPGYVIVHWSAKPGAAAPFYRAVVQFSAIRLTEHQFGRRNG
jgi:hypothetical protein